MANASYAQPSSVRVLERTTYLSLTTFRRDGRPVATPVWFALDGDSILIWTGANEWKAKRIRNNPNVMVAACDFKGQIRGSSLAGTGHLLGPTAAPRVHRLLNRKYWYVKPLYNTFLLLSRLVSGRLGGEAAYIEIRLSSTPPPDLP